jgi:DNA polymerase-3 subunit delta'
MREYLSRVVGNVALRARLGGELSRGAAPHAYIIEGAFGSGKHTLAREIATALSCEHRGKDGLPLPCGICPSCRKIAAGNSPDVITVSREEDKATMGIDVIRALRDDVPILPNDLDVKIYIIEDAHTMTQQAQNALLLTLEEPPPFVMFLLLAERAELLLETIRSRAPILRMQPIADAQMREYLLSPERPEVAREAKALPPGDLDALLRMANGAIGRALVLLEEKKRAPVMARRAAAEQLCRTLAQMHSQDELLALLMSFGTARDELQARLQTVTEALRDLLLLCYAEQAPLIFFTDRASAEELSACFAAERLLGFLHATEQTMEMLSMNANTRLTMFRYLELLLKK